MKKNGFTLIELLAVIVILAIIALIATPIILGIINDAREKANERSVELYASAVRNGIAAYQLREGKEVLPGIYNETNKLPFEVEYDGKVDCENVIISEDGKISLDKCTVNGGTKEYSYGIEEETPSLVGTMGICNPISVQTEGVYTAGDKYECDVDPNKEGYDYTFYVLTSASEGATSVNLIMDSNINKSGNAVKGEESDLGLEAWILEVDYPGSDWNAMGDGNSNAYGPITAMNHLQSATSSWTNVNAQTVNMFTACDSYDSCEDKIMTEYVVNARMPYLSEVSDYSASANNAYLYDNLGVECCDDAGDETSCDEATEKYGVFEEGIEHIQGVWGYWTLSSYASLSDLAWFVVFRGRAADDFVYADGYSGVRPVINLTI